MGEEEGEVVRFGFARVNNVSLHYAEAGSADDPLLILLHGFPEFWFGWREMLEPLAAAGFHVIAPDQRGYNLSDKPRGVKAYTLSILARDVFALAGHFGAERFDVVGHDWGAAVAWSLADENSPHLGRVVIINAPHPAIWLRAMRMDRGQGRQSRYVRFFRLPWVPEILIRASKFRALESAFDSMRGSSAFTADLLNAYRRAWRRPGALTAMLNWYRALFGEAVDAPPPQGLSHPILVLWGDRDAFASPDLADRSAALCANVIVKHFGDATHWVVHEEPDAIRTEIIKFLLASGDSRVKQTAMGSD
jgi:pimeloyl-ACP methyl ester carboxylesterase